MPQYPVSMNGVGTYWANCAVSRVSTSMTALPSSTMSCRNAGALTIASSWPPLNAASVEASSEKGTTSHLLPIFFWRIPA